MINNDFYGKKGFIWWVGIVEDRDDPMKLGAVRARIVGIHSEDKSLVPTSSLPWAQVLQPSTGAKTTSGPREGDWVFGFFQDGDYAQIPVVMGMFPGVESVQSQTIYRQAVIRKGSSNVPVPAQFDRTVGEQTSYRMARGVMEGTLVNATNQQLSAVCDIGGQVNWVVEHITGFFGLVVKAIRAGIRAALAALGFEPSGLAAKIIQIAKTINSIATKILRTLEKITNGIATLLRVAREIRALIEYILSLPDKILKFLRDCLQKAIGQIAAGIASILADPDGATEYEGFGDFSALNSELTELRRTATQIFSNVSQIVTAPAQLAEAFLNPASAQDIESAEKSFNEFIGAVKTEGQTQNNNLTYNSQKVLTP
jgi:hypothetical protein